MLSTPCVRFVLLLFSRVLLSSTLFLVQVIFQPPFPFRSLYMLPFRFAIVSQSAFTSINHSIFLCSTDSFNDDKPVERGNLVDLELREFLHWVLEAQLEAAVKPADIDQEKMKRGDTHRLVRHNSYRRSGGFGCWLEGDGDGGRMAAAAGGDWDGTIMQKQ